jgi:polysaccharide biosynthesis protein PelA
MMSPNPTTADRTASCARLLVAAMVFVCSALPAFGSIKFCVNYSATPDMEELKRHDLSILSPYARVDVHALIRSAHRPFAYLSAVEIAPDARYRAEVERLGIPLLGKNANWGGDIADVSDPKWTDFVVNHLAAAAVKQGYRGFFLDTLDSVAMAEQAQPEKGKAFREGLVRLIRALKKAYPDRDIILNRGFGLLSSVAEVIDGVMVESLFQKYDFNTKAYLPESADGSQWLLNILGKIRNAGLNVYVLDYVAENDLALAARTARRIESLGYNAFISTVALDGKFLNDASVPPLPPGAIEFPRQILALYGNNSTNVEYLTAYPTDSGVSHLLQMPLEWFGYDVEYSHAWKDELPATVSSEIAGIIVDRGVTIPPAKERAVADWLIARKRDGLKILFMGNIPFEDPAVRAHIAKEFGMGGTALTLDGLRSLKLERAGKHTSYEAPVQLTLADFADLQAPAGADVWISFSASKEGKRVTFDPVFLTSWGGAMLDPHILFMRPDEYEMWKIDPFEFIRHWLGDPAFPGPDTTTRDGVRMFFAHIDGDGFRHKSRARRGSRSGDYIYQELIRKYPFPVTCSIIEAEVSAAIVGQGEGDVKLLTSQAREMFRDEKVEAGSHSYSHPFFWLANDRNLDIYDRRNLEIKPERSYGQNVDYYREVVGSIRFIEKELLPPGKTVEIMLWSGNCRPGSQALEWCTKLGVENMNGGDTAMTRKNRSFTRVFGATVPWGDSLQVYAAHQNENVYRLRWKGGSSPDSVFWSGFVLALDSFNNTEEPRRIKPVNIYYHWYSGDNIASFNALKQLYEWSSKQELHSVTAAPYARIARDARATRMYRAGPNRWIARNGGHCRTFRMRWTGDVPDLARSVGVSGWRRHKDTLYIHTTGTKQTEIALAKQPERHLYLESSTAEIRFQKLSANAAEFQLKDFRPCRVVMGGLEAGESVNVTVNRNTRAFRADKDGKLWMQFPAESRVKIAAK